MSKAPKRSKLLYIISAFLIGMGLLFFSVGTRIIAVEKKYDSVGVQVQGEVVGKRVVTRADSDNRQTTDFFVRYKFKTIDNREFEGESSVGKIFYDGATSGAPVEVQYLVDNPDENRLPESAGTLAGWIFMIIGPILALAGVWLIVLDIKHRRLVGRLLVEGMKTEAVVSKTAPGNVKINDETQWQIHYSYKDFMGGSHSGVSSHMRPSEAAEWNEGDKGVVRYLKEAPAKHFWFGKDQ